ncbi:MAG: hypothetical protein R6T89_02625, partial [Candidatus Syntrophosphaera sp.]
KEESDRVFAIELFRKAIINHSTFNEVISSKTRNWDVERIALMDINLAGVKEEKFITEVKERSASLIGQCEDLAAGVQAFLADRFE